VQPQDVPDLNDIPLGDGDTSLQIRDDGATLTTNINGVPVDVRVDRNGFSVQPSGRIPVPSPSPSPLPTLAPPIRPGTAPERNTGPPQER
jgi:penicillin-binding protein 1A